MGLNGKGEKLLKNFPHSLPRCTGAYVLRTCDTQNKRKKTMAVVSKRFFLTLLFVLLSIATLSLGGVVLSRFVWLDINSSASPCIAGTAEYVAAVRENITHAAALLSPEAPSLELSLGHLIPFSFLRVCFVPPYTNARQIENIIQHSWPCAGQWERTVTNNDAYTSLLIITAADTVSVPVLRVNADFPDLQGTCLNSPATRLMLQKAPGRNTALVHAAPPKKQVP